MNNKKILVIGGDKRLCHTANCFADEGFETYTWNGAKSPTVKAEKMNDIKKIIKDCKVVILPIPAFSSNGKLMCENADRISTTAESLFRYISNETNIYGGNFSELSKRIASEYNLTLFDYGKREEFSLLNAVPTAEAAIFEAMKHIDKTVADSCFTVVGYGRVGKALAIRLKALGGHVTVAARSKQALAGAESDGLYTVCMKEYLSSGNKCDVCYNTVPYPIITDDSVGASDCNLYIDLASVPGGFTEEARTVLGDRLITALSLPGKYSPETAGKIIYKTVKGMIEEAEK